LLPARLPAIGHSHTHAPEQRWIPRAAGAAAQLTDDRYRPEQEVEHHHLPPPPPVDDAPHNRCALSAACLEGAQRHPWHYRSLSVCFPHASPSLIGSPPIIEIMMITNKRLTQLHVDPGKKRIKKETFFGPPDGKPPPTQHLCAQQQQGPFFGTDVRHLSPSLTRSFFPM
jgi:hypothetical protein